MSRQTYANSTNDSSAADLSFECTYVPDLAGGRVGLAGSELAPLRLDVYGTHQLGGAPPNRTHFTELSKSHSMRVEMWRGDTEPPRPFAEAGFYAAEDHLRLCDTSAATKTSVAAAAAGDVSSHEHYATHVSASTAVIVRAYATTFTDVSQKTQSHAGTAVISLTKLVEASRSRRSITLEFPLVQNRGADSDFVKGRLLIESSSIRVSRQLKRIDKPTEEDIDALPSIAVRAATVSTSYIDRCMAVYFSANAPLATPTKQFLRPFHVPEFRTPRMPLPASAYSLLLPPVETIDIAYYEQLLTIAIARTLGPNARRDQPLSRILLAAVSIRLITVFATSQVYLSDFCNRNRATRAWNADLVEQIEDFKLCRLCGSDDCEGVALEVHMHMRQLCSGNLSSETLCSMSEPLRLVRAFLSRYTSTLALGCVTNARLVATQLDPSTVMAHTFATLIERRWFVNAAPRRLRSQVAQALGVASTHYAPERLAPVLIGEGTAPMDPLMRSVADYYDDDDGAGDGALAKANTEKRRYITDVVGGALQSADAGYANVEVFTAPWKRTVDEDLSHFYKYAVSVAVPDLGPIDTIDWALVYNAEDDEQRTVGVTNNDLLEGSPSVGLWPIATYTKREAALCDASLADQEPIPQLRLAKRTRSGIVDASVRRRLTKFVETVNNNNNGRSVGRSTETQELHARRTFITARSRDVDNRFVTALQIAHQKQSFRSATYREYTLNESVDGSGLDNSIVDFYLEF